MQPTNVFQELKTAEIKPEDYEFRAFPVAGKFQGRLVRKQHPHIMSRSASPDLITVMTTGKEIFATEIEALFAVRNLARRVKAAYIKAFSE